MAAELLPHMFDLFVQGVRGSDRRQGGLGVGLALVRRLVELHGGEVSAASAGPQRGTQISVRLPRIEARRAPAMSDKPLGSGTTARRVLVVDDNYDAAGLLGDLLRSLGHDVAVANTSAAAIEIAHRFGPQVAILDIGMPEMDGYELAQALRVTLGASVRMIAVTGYGQDQDRAQSADAGFAAHFAKPVALAKLVAAIDG